MFKSPLENRPDERSMRCGSKHAVQVLRSMAVSREPEPTQDEEDKGVRTRLISRLEACKSEWSLSGLAHGMERLVCDSSYGLDRTSSTV